MPASGVITSGESSKRSGVEASGPCLSDPAIGWQGTKFRGTMFIFFRIDVFTLPTSNIGTDAPVALFAANTQPDTECVGTATHTKSAPESSLRSSIALSMIPNEIARSMVDLSLSMPTILLTVLYFRAAKATEPPIKPVPTKPSTVIQRSAKHLRIVRFLPAIRQ